MSDFKEKISAIREATDIVRLIESRVSLRKQGQRFVGLCPFHSEKTPSFSVNPQKQFFYCFGCHATGDCFTFLMCHEGLDFRQAAQRLAKDAGIELTPESPAQRQRREAEAELVRVNEYAQAFFQKALQDSKGEPARNYLRDRGIPQATAKTWQMGYGGQSDEFLAYLDAKKVPRTAARKAGLLNDEGSRCLFDNRVTFPIRDERNRLVGFGGRRLGEGQTAKYINTRESPIFQKRRLLFGWAAASDCIRQTRRAVLVEGFTDVLSCHQAGIEEAVATLGTALTGEHLKVVGRLAKEVVLLLDADGAGQKAAREGAGHVMAAGLACKVATLPKGDDPDSFLQREGAEALKGQVSRSKPVLEHFIDVDFKDEKLSVEERVAAATALAPLLTRLSSGLERDLYLARIAERVGGVSTDQLAAHIARTKSQTRKKSAHKSENPPKKAIGAQPPAPKVVGPDRTELGMLRELLLYPELRSRCGELAQFAQSKAMKDLLLALADSEEPLEEVLPPHVPDVRTRERLLAQKPVEGDAQNATKTFEDVLARLKLRHMEYAHKDMMAALSTAESEGQETDELLRQIQNLTRRKQELKRALAGN